MMRPLKLFVCLILPACAVWSAEPKSAEDFLRAIRANDLAALKSMSADAAGVRDRLDWTPLHYAALYGSVDSVRLLLAAGADPNARNRAEITPLMMGAWNLEKTRLMLEKGGNVNAQSSNGSTPLWVALGAHGNDATIRLLIDKGADVKVLRGGGNVLLRAGSNVGPEIVKLLLAKGVDPKLVSASGDTPIDSAVDFYSPENLRVLLAAGADPNVANRDGGFVRNGPIESTGVTPLMDAAAAGEASTVGALLKAGAKLNTQDDRKMTALMMAVASDRAMPSKVRELLAAGADVNVADRYGETALDWARKHRNPEIIALLEKAGAKEKGLLKAPVRPADYHPDAKTAVDRAGALLATSSEAFFREGGGCTGCHHQPWAGKAYGALKTVGVSANPKLRQILVDAAVADRARVMNSSPLLLTPGGGFDGSLYTLSALGDLGEPASDATDVMVHLLAASQHQDGYWALPTSRPPLQESDITRTRLAIQALKQYGWPARQTEFTERIAKARTWLKSAKAYTNVDEMDRLMGLWLAGAPEAELKKLAASVLAMQKPDGGWTQTKYLDSDALGTSAALYTLWKTGFLKVSAPAYQKGVNYLLSTQFPDGSWYVRSRAVKLQPYFQSAFPYNHDQWISNSATGYAVMALAPAAGK